MLLLCVLAACEQLDDATPTPEIPQTLPTLIPVALPESEWGEVQLIAQAEQSFAPSLVYVDDAPIFTWTGSFGREARHFSRNISNRSQIMALSAYFPMQQALFPVDDGVLMFWLDRTDSEFELRLQVARFSENGVAEVGAVPLSTQFTRQFSARMIDTGLFRVVWSGGLGQVTNLYLHQVDSQGRPVEGNRLRIDADYPVLIQDDAGQVYLFWLENNRRDVYYGRFDDSDSPTLVDIRRIASANISGTDTIEHFDVGFDGETAIIFWNIRHVDNTRTVLFSTGRLSDERFTVPSSLLTSEGEPVHWANVAQTTQSPLPVVVNAGENLSILWLQDGEVEKTESVANSGDLIGLPTIRTTDTIIGIAWSQSTEQGYANLFYTSRER